MTRDPFSSSGLKTKLAPWLEFFDFIVIFLVSFVPNTVCIGQGIGQGIRRDMECIAVESLGQLFILYLKMEKRRHEANTIRLGTFGFWQESPPSSNCYPRN